MKKILAAFAFAAAVAAVPAVAAQGPIMKADIPFDFQVGAKTMPAGEYQVVTGVATGALLVRTPDAKQSAMIMTIGTDRVKDSESAFVFANTNGRHVLTTVTHNGEETELAGPKPKKGAIVAKIRAISLQ